jgi:restriction system protein
MNTSESPLPTYQDMMLPILQVLAKQGKLHQKDYASQAADLLNIPDAQRQSLLPSGSQPVFYNRAGWAVWYLMQAGLLSKPKRGWAEITEEGRKLLATNPPKVDNKVLAKYPSFVEKVLTKYPNVAGKTLPSAATEATESENGTPDEQIASAYSKLNQTLATDLLTTLRKMDHFKFEQLVVDLLLAMGYGGSREEAAQVTKKSGDEGIDGIIKEDRLGLDVIYVQAKRYQEDSSISREKLQSFVGALSGKHASKGVFITTSQFAETAINYAASVPQKVILIDGERLAELMIEHDVGVTTRQLLKVKQIDTDYFEEL